MWCGKCIRNWNYCTLHIRTVEFQIVFRITTWANDNTVSCYCHSSLGFVTNSLYFRFILLQIVRLFFIFLFFSFQFKVPVCINVDKRNIPVFCTFVCAFSLFFSSMFFTLLPWLRQYFANVFSCYSSCWRIFLSGALRSLFILFFCLIFFLTF